MATLIDRFAADELDDLDHWLTARWRLYAARRSGLKEAQAEHLPWQLHRAELTRLSDELVTAAGLRPPTGAPIVHWSPGVDVLVSRPFPVPAVMAPRC